MAEPLPAVGGGMAELGEREFGAFRRMIYETAGIHMAPGKRSLVAGRLAKRLKALQLADYASYLDRIADDPEERQRAVDLLTTNETYFFREPKHFDVLRERVLPGRAAGQPMRVWSAACSSGEEPYSVAMLLAEALGQSDWRVIGSDISSVVLERARAGRYPMSRAERIPRELLKRYCLRGTGAAEGSFLIDRPLRNRVEFRQINLNAALPALPEFDLILLRNVMIYFDLPTKQQVVGRLLTKLKPGGWLFIGHSESLNSVHAGLELVAPSVYRKPL